MAPRASTKRLEKEAGRVAGIAVRYDPNPGRWNRGPKADPGRLADSAFAPLAERRAAPWGNPARRPSGLGSEVGAGPASVLREIRPTEFRPKGTPVGPARPEGAVPLTTNR